MSKSDESKVVFTPHDLDARVTELWRSGRKVLVLEGAEESRYKTAIKNAAATITKERDVAAKADGNTSKPVRMIAHDRWGGFYTGLPDIVPSPDKKSPVLANALQMAMFTKEEIERHFGREYLEPSTDPNKPNLVKLPFDPAEDLIFVFNSFESEVQNQQLTQTLIRKIMSANACSPIYIKDKAEAAGRPYDEGLGGYPGFTRGTRMIIFVSPIGDFPNTIPELKPEIVPLPDSNALEECVLDVLEPLFELCVETKGKRGAKKPEETEWEMMVNSGKGMTCADFEEAVSLAWTRILNKFKADKRTGGIPFDEKDIASFLNIIEKEKAKALAKIPGLTYVPKEQIVDTALPGHESVVDWIRTRQKVIRSKAKKRGVTPIRGLTLGGMPGIGKTEFAKYLAYLTGRTCGIWDTGASKGSHVGDTEKNTKLVMQVARAIDMLVLCDDIDKGSISKSRDYSGDGGTSGNQVQMLLTDMSDPASNVIWVFTFNRVPNLPEIMRMGRIDKQYIVERPNAETRLGILKNHIARTGMTIDDENGLKTLAGDLTKDWTGAELAHRLVKEEVFRAMAEESEELQVDRMIEDTKGFIPMIHQKTFAEDIREMEEACSQFEHIGNRRIETVVAGSGKGASRSRRATAAA